MLFRAFEVQSQIRALGNVSTQTTTGPVEKSKFRFLESATLSSGGLSSRAGSGTRTPHQGFVDAFLFSAIWHALGGKRGLERPGLDVAVTALAGGELTVGDEFWARHGENGVTSDAYLEALVACKDRVRGPEFRWLPQAPPQSVAETHALLINSVAHYAGRLESDAVVLFRMPRPPTVSCLSTRRMHNRRRW